MSSISKLWLGTVYRCQERRASQKVETRRRGARQEKGMSKIIHFTGQLEDLFLFPLLPIR